MEPHSLTDVNILEPFKLMMLVTPSMTHIGHIQHMHSGHVVSIRDMSIDPLISLVISQKAATRLTNE